MSALWEIELAGVDVVDGDEGYWEWKVELGGRVEMVSRIRGVVVRRTIVDEWDQQ